MQRIDGRTLQAMQEESLHLPCPAQLAILGKPGCGGGGGGGVGCAFGMIFVPVFMLFLTLSATCSL